MNSCHIVGKTLALLLQLLLQVDRGSQYSFCSLLFALQIS